jgi:ATP-dependent Zn protease
MDKMAQLLLEKETINGTEIEELIKEYADENWRSGMNETASAL